MFDDDGIMIHHLSLVRLHYPRLYFPYVIIVGSFGTKSVDVGIFLLSSYALHLPIVNIH